MLTPKFQRHSAHPLRANSHAQNQMDLARGLIESDMTEMLLHYIADFTSHYHRAIGSAPQNYAADFENIMHDTNQNFIFGTLIRIMREKELAGEIPEDAINLDACVGEVSLMRAINPSTEQYNQDRSSKKMNAQNFVLKTMDSLALSNSDKPKAMLSPSDIAIKLLRKSAVERYLTELTSNRDQSRMGQSFTASEKLLNDLQSIQNPNETLLTEKLRAHIKIKIRQDFPELFDQKLFEDMIRRTIMVRTTGSHLWDMSSPHL